MQQQQMYHGHMPVYRGNMGVGQVFLYDPKQVRQEVIQELEGMYGFRGKEASGCLADIMICQKKDKCPAIAFSLVGASNDPPDNSEEVIDRFNKVDKAFPSAYAIAILPLAIHPQLQFRYIESGSNLKLFTTNSIQSTVRLIVSIYEKSTFEVSQKALILNEKMQQHYLTRVYAIKILHENLSFLSMDECDMLLDLYGSIGALSQVSAAEILDTTVLSSTCAHAIEEFFQAEYVLE